MSKKLLLADDSITIQKVIGITFANEDYDLTIVDNGATALEKARADRPDLILSDVFMPGKNGYELATAVKREPTLQGVPVLLLAGTFEPFDEDKARSSGADDWISKPFESQALIDRVEELLAKSAAAAPAPKAAVETPSAGREEEQADDWGETIDLDQESASVEDDLWGAVSFGEEDLGDEQDEFELESLEEDPFEFGEAAPEISGAAEEDDFLFADEPLELADSPIGEATLPLAEENPFVFEEEPRGQEGETPADQWELAESEEEEFVFEEDPLELMEEPPAGEQPAEGEDEAITEGAAFAWDESEEDDIFLLEEADILEEEELEVESFGTAVTTSANENPAWADVETLAADEDEDISAETGPAFAAEMEAEENLSLSEEGPDWGIAEPESADGEEPLAFEEETAPSEPVSPSLSAAAVVDSVAGQVQGLSEEDLARVVERVAGTVIERLAATVIEKIAWEVVPDLAESMIRDELRKLKGEG